MAKKRKHIDRARLTSMCLLHAGVSAGEKDGEMNTIMTKATQMVNALYRFAKNTDSSDVLWGVMRTGGELIQTSLHLIKKDSNEKTLNAYNAVKFLFEELLAQRQEKGAQSSFMKEDLQYWGYEIHRSAFELIQEEIFPPTRFDMRSTRAIELSTNALLSMEWALANADDDLDDQYDNNNCDFSCFSKTATFQKGDLVEKKSVKKKEKATILGRLSDFLYLVQFENSDEKRPLNSLAVFEERNIKPRNIEKENALREIDRKMKALQKEKAKLEGAR